MGRKTTIVLIVVLSLIVAYNVVFALYIIADRVHRFHGHSPVDLVQRYGKSSFVVITGASSGQGKLLAHAFAKGGLNLILIGSERSNATRKEIEEAYSGIIVKVFVRDFCKAFEDGFLDDIDFSEYDISMLVNNAGHRVAWAPTHEMPINKIRDTIACGCMLQSKITALLLPQLLARKQKTGIVTITAQSVHPQYGISMAYSSQIHVPFLPYYEAANVFGHYHMMSLYEEYGSKLDMLIITPGAVLTENTDPMLKKVPFSIQDDKFVANIMKLVGNYNGETCGSMGHEFSSWIASMSPWIKKRVLKETGQAIAQTYMDKNNT